MSKRVVGRILIVAASLVIAVYIAFLWLATGVSVTVRNGGELPLYGLTIQTTGNSYQLGDLPRGTEKGCQVQAKGESAVEITYQLEDGSTKCHKLDCYFESGYRGKIEAEVGNGQLISVTHEIWLPLL